MSALYPLRHYDLGGLRGVSDSCLESHFDVYREYVNATNLLAERIAQLARQFADQGEAATIFPLLERRLAFEFHGMVLHEHYFGNLTRDGAGEPARASAFRAAAEASFGGFDAWRNDFARLGCLRGAGWVMACVEPSTGRLSNHRIMLNEMQPLSKLTPVIVLDGWDHAYVPDFKPTGRHLYVETFFANVDWSVVEARLGARIPATVSSETSLDAIDTGLALPTGPMGE
jgi:Fe-Mn family superoxide dismutase